MLFVIEKSGKQRAKKKKLSKENLKFIVSYRYLHYNSMYNKNEFIYRKKNVDISRNGIPIGPFFFFFFFKEPSNSSYSSLVVYIGVFFFNSTYKAPSTWHFAIFSYSLTAATE